MYDFDKVIDRKNTNCYKYDYAIKSGMKEDGISFSIADMDFQGCEEIRKAIVEYSKEGIYGYTYPGDNYYNALSNWYLKHFNYQVKKENTFTTPGVVYALSIAIKAFTNVKDKVLINKPVYPPFFNTVLVNDREVVDVPLLYENNTYKLDFENIEKIIKQENIKLYILCSPHNPVGRVWTKEELIKLGDICYKNNCIIIADEIHSDFTFPNVKHHMFNTLGEKYKEISVVCTAPSKTFNIAGLQVSNIFIENENLKKKFEHELEKTCYHELNCLGVEATVAAYKYGEIWLDEVKKYIYSNYLFVKEFIKERMPLVKLIDAEGTYLLWLDFTELVDKTKCDLNLVLNEANIKLNPGEMFGEGYDNFQRINIATSRILIRKGLERLEEVIKKII